MRTRIGALAVTAALLCASSGFAQKAVRSNGFGSVSPSEITYKPIDTGNTSFMPQGTKLPTPALQQKPGFFKNMWAKMPGWMGGAKKDPQGMPSSGSMPSKKKSSDSK